MAKKIARDNVAVSLKLPVSIHADMTLYAKSRMLSLADFLRQSALHEMERPKQIAA